MPRRVVVTQSNYLPWRGYFDLVASADDFVIYDTAQYTKRDWRNRNRIRSGNGARWLSVPVRVSGRFDQRICDTEVADSGWWRSHLSILDASYRGFQGYDSLCKEISALYHELDGAETLSRINRLTLGWLLDLLQIGTAVHDASEIPHAGNPTERLVQLACHLNATTYVTGPAAQDYLEEDRFEAAGISVEYFDYGSLPPDPGALPLQAGELSVLDIVARLGADARSLIPNARRWDRT